MLWRVDRGEIVPQTETRNQRITALYCRLSKADGDDAESDSIQNQKEILGAYAIERGYYFTSFYVDDGFSGTDFERPDFKRMMADIEAGIIERVVVKDISRLGRLQTDVGWHIEKIFVQHDVQFVSLAEQDGEMLPFHNLVKKIRCLRRVFAIPPHTRQTASIS